MVPKPSARSPKGTSSNWIGFIAALAVAGAAFLPLVFLAIMVAAIASVLTFEMGRGLVRRGLRARKVFALVLTIAFAVLVALKGETGLLIGATLTLMGMAAAYMSGRVEARSVPAFAASIFCVLYVGFTSSYLLLIKKLNFGARLLAALVIMVLVFRVATRLASRLRYPEMAPGSGSTLSWQVASIGILASVAGALATFPLLKGSVGIVTILVLGAVVGIACVIGELGAALVTSADGNPSVGAARNLFDQLMPVMLAAPAFFYGIRLYLT
jgi:hypothetical protein